MSTLRIAIIAADMQVLKLIEGWLHEDAATSEIESFNSPKKAVSVLRSTPPFDLIITTESFAEVGGLIWLKALRKLFPHTSLAVLASNESPSEAIRAAVDEDPSSVYLTQPYDRQLLLGDLYQLPALPDDMPADILVDDTPVVDVFAEPAAPVDDYMDRSAGDAPMDTLADIPVSNEALDLPAEMADSIDTFAETPASVEPIADPADPVDASTDNTGRVGPTESAIDDVSIEFSADDLPSQTDKEPAPEPTSQEGYFAGSQATASLSDNQHKKMEVLLKTMKENISAHSIYLVDHLGQSLFHSGNAASEHLVEIASLLGGSFAALLEVGEIVDDQESPMNLIYRQGEKDDIYALSVASTHLLILMIARGPYTTRVGTVWYYVREVAPALTEILSNLGSSTDESPFDGEMSAALNEELESLLPSIPPEGWTIHPKDPSEGEDWPFGEEDHNGAQEKEEVFDLQSANEMGLIPEDILEKLMPTNKVELATGELKAE